MKYQLILFDADDTLFDFLKSERAAFWSALEVVGHKATDEIFSTYREINIGLWKQFEQNQIAKDQIKVSRYQQLFERFKINGDPHHASTHFQEMLSQQHHLLDGALELCKELKNDARLAIVTNGIEFIQKRRMSLSEIRHHIELMVVSEQCGFHKPDVRIFDYTLEQAKHLDRKSVLMIGDRLETDILGGINAGIATCWYNPSGAKNDSEIHPTHEVNKLADILSLI